MTIDVVPTYWHQSLIHNLTMLHVPLAQSYGKKLNSNYLRNYKPHLPMLMIKVNLCYNEMQLKAYCCFDPEVSVGQGSLAGRLEAMTKVSSCKETNNDHLILEVSSGHETNKE
jgi:hypothetical protein